MRQNNQKTNKSQDNAKTTNTHEENTRPEHPNKKKTSESAVSWSRSSAGSLRESVPAGIPLHATKSSGLTRTQTKLRTAKQRRQLKQHVASPSCEQDERRAVSHDYRCLFCGNCSSFGGNTSEAGNSPEGDLLFFFFDASTHRLTQSASNSSRSWASSGSHSSLFKFT